MSAACYMPGKLRAYIHTNSIDKVFRFPPTVPYFYLILNFRRWISKKSLKCLGTAQRTFWTYTDLNQAPDRRHGKVYPLTTPVDQDTHRALQVQIHRKTFRVGWIVQIRTLKIWVSPYLLAYRCHQDTHHTLQIQIHQTTPRVDGIEQIGILNMKVSDSLSYDWLSSGHLSRFAGSNPRNDTSSGLDRTDLDTKDEG